VKDTKDPPIEPHRLRWFNPFFDVNPGKSSSSRFALMFCPPGAL